MRKAIFMILFCTIVVSAYFYFSYTQTSNFQPQHSNLKLPTSNVPAKPPATFIEYNDKTYAIYLHEIKDPERLKLIPNFVEKKSSLELMEEHKCIAGINGGFYTKEGNPLGLFITEGNQIQPLNTESTLLTGLFYKTSSNSLFLVPTVFARGPLANGAITTSFEFALQSGPFFTSETVLKIRDDEYARRSLIAGTSESRFFFVALADALNENSGPLLANVPKILSLLPHSIFQIQDSTFLNLDGGSASAFHDENVNLNELVTIGNFLCISPPLRLPTSDVDQTRFHI